MQKRGRHTQSTDKPQKRQGRNFLPLLLLLIGLSIFLYPFVSDRLAAYQRSLLLKSYETSLKNADSNSISEEYQQALDYNARLVNSAITVRDPFDPNAKIVQPEEYNKQLNDAQDGIMGILNIPAIQLKLPIYHGVSDEVLSKGAGHLESTSLPVGGPSSHAVITGHTGLTTAILFDHIDRLKVGDVFSINVLDHQLNYQIYKIETVLPEQTESLRIQEGEDLVTLITCTPYGINTHRLLIHARRTNDSPTEARSGFYVANDFFAYWYIYVAVLVILLAILLFYLFRTRKKKNKKLQKRAGKHFKK